MEPTPTHTTVIPLCLSLINSLQPDSRQTHSFMFTDYRFGLHNMPFDTFCLMNCRPALFVPFCLGKLSRNSSVFLSNHNVFFASFCVFHLSPGIGIVQRYSLKLQIKIARDVFVSEEARASTLETQTKICQQFCFLHSTETCG